MDTVLSIHLVSYVTQMKNLHDSLATTTPDWKRLSFIMKNLSQKQTSHQLHETLMLLSVQKGSIVPNS